MSLCSYSVDGGKLLVKLGYSPIDADPRVCDHIGRFKIGLIGMIGLRIASNAVVCFSDSFFLKGSGRASKEVQKVKWAGSDVAYIVQGMVDRARSSLLLKNSPAVVLEML